MLHPNDYLTMFILARITDYPIVDTFSPSHISFLHFFL
jgi:hypothetical protein